MRNIDRLINHVDGATYLDDVDKVVIRRRLERPPHEAELLVARLELALDESCRRTAAELRAEVDDVLEAKARAALGDV